MAPLSLFLLGATGYIGGAALVQLRAVYPEWKITALVRHEKDIDAVKAAGADHVIHGCHDEHEKIRSACAMSDIVLNAADADDLPLTRSVIAGLKMRAWHTNGDSKPILIHTSGTGLLYEGITGSFVTEATKVWNDESEDDIRAIDASKPHRLIDLEIFGADEAGDIRAFIIAPSTIYGLSKGPVHRISIQVPNMIRAAIRRRQTVYIGEGTNEWNNVHIDDLVDLYLLVFKHALDTQSTSGGSSYSRFFFGSAHTHVWGDVARSLASILYRKGLVDSPDAKSVSREEEPRITSTNSRSIANRSFALGWKPHRRSILDTLEEDVDATVSSLATI